MPPATRRPRAATPIVAQLPIFSANDPSRTRLTNIISQKPEIVIPATPADTPALNVRKLYAQSAALDSIPVCTTTAAMPMLEGTVNRRGRGWDDLDPVADRLIPSVFQRLAVKAKTPVSSSWMMATRA